MAAGTFQLYDGTAKALLTGSDLINASTDVRVVLVGSTYTPALTTHGKYEDLTSELTTANGYTNGGQTLTGTAVAQVTANGGYKWSSSNAQWTASGGSIPSWKYAVFYYDATVEGVTKPLLGYFEGESGSTVPATTDTNTLTLNCPANGWFTCGRS